MIWLGWVGLGWVGLGWDPGYGRGVLFCAFYFSGQGSLARVTPLFLCDLTYSSCFTLTKLIRNAKVI